MNISNYKVVAELSTSNSEDYSSCVEDLASHVKREKTVLIKEILGKIYILFQSFIVIKRLFHIVRSM